MKNENENDEIQKVLESLQKIFRSALKSVGWHDREDLIQDANLAAVLILREKRFDAGKSGLTTFFWRVVVNKLNSFLRRDYAQKKLLGEYAQRLSALNKDLPVGALAEEKEFREKLIKAVDAKDCPSLKNVLELVLLDGKLTGKEIAEILGLHPSYVSRLMERIRLMTRRLLE